jgi:hypothetical protein
MTRDEALKALREVQAAMHEQFGDHPARLDQLDSHMATVVMVVEHLYDEEVRHKHDPVRHLKARGEYVRED